MIRIRWIYGFVRFLLLSLLALMLLLFVALDSPKVTLKVLESPMQQQGISYTEVEGSLLSGFEILGFNYQDKLKAQKVAFAMDFEALIERKLRIETLEVERLEIEEHFLTTFVENNEANQSKEEQNLSLPFDEVVIDEIKLSLANITYEVYFLKELQLSAKGIKSDLKQHHEGDLTFVLESNVAKSRLNAKLQQNHLILEGELEGEDAFINRFLVEQQVELIQNPKLSFELTGDLNQSHLVCKFSDLKAKQGEMWGEVETLNLMAEVQATKGEMKLNLASDLNTFAAQGNLNGDLQFNLYDVNNTLFADLHSSLMVEASYANGFLKEHNVSLLENVPLSFEVKGNMEKLDLDVNSSAKLLAQGITSKLELQTQGIHLDLVKQKLKGALHLQGQGEALAFNLEGDVAGDYMKPTTLEVNSNLTLERFKAFNVDLTTLTPLALNLQKRQEQVTLALESERLKLVTQSPDLDQFEFSLEADTLYPAKIVSVPEALEGKYLSANLNGFTTLSKAFISLEGDVRSNKDFKLNLSVEQGSNGLEAQVSSEHLLLTAKGDIEQKNLAFTTEIDSLKKLQQELQKVYVFEPVPIDGKVALSGRLEQERLALKVNMDKLVHDLIEVRDMAIDAVYDRDVVRLNTLAFTLLDRENPKIKQDFYLTKTAQMTLGERRDIELELYPNIALTSKGTANDFKATLLIDALKLDHPSYGQTQLTCDIDYVQNATKKRVVGGLYLDKLNLFYESKFLDPSYDRDVIVLNKKSQKNQQEEDPLKDMEIDVKVYAKDAKYKTRDIDLQFTVNLDVKKQQQEELRLLGRIQEIEGKVEQAPKLFTVTDSNVVFTGAKEINPLLDLTVEYALPEVLIQIDIRGNAKRPKLTFSSEPTLPKKDILSYLLLGVSTANVVEGEGSLSREAQLFIMNQAARDLAQDVELDRVFIKDDGTGEGYDVQVGKKLNEETMFVLEKNKEGNSFILEYDINKDIKVEVGQHQKAVPSQSIDFYYRKRFK